MADWGKIKREYVTGDISYGALAKKYHIAKSQIGHRGADEKWVEEREQFRAELATKTAERITDQTAAAATKLLETAQLLMDRVAEVSQEVYDPRDLRALVAALKDLRDINGIKADMDLREQEARIEKLRKDAQREDSQQSGIVITLEGDGAYDG